MPKIRRFFRGSTLAISERLPKSSSIEDPQLDHLIKSQGYLFIERLFDIKSLQTEQIQSLAKSLAIDASKQEPLQKELGYPAYMKYPFIDARSSRETFPDRSGKIDVGLTEVSSPHLLDPCCTSSSALNSLCLGALIASTRTYIDQTMTNLGFTYHHSSLYLFDSVTRPRCLHIDSLSNFIKVFVLLSDTSSYESGPYAFIPKSHTKSLRKTLALLLNTILGSDLGESSLDMTLHSSNEAVVFAAPSGSMIVTYQNGVHGDLPALPNKTKAALVLKYIP